jgi:hypothetical protein
VKSFRAIHQTCFITGVVLWIWLNLYPIQTYACDACGCSVNANYFGILPQFNRHFIGVRMMQSNFDMRHTPTLFPKENPNFKEKLNRYEIWGRFYMTNRIVVFASLPWQNNIRIDQGTATYYNGLSDATLSANYILINTGDSGRFALRNTLMIGGGVKLPTGKFRSDRPASIQTGTGTWDYNVNVIYTIRYKNWGLNTDATYRINGSSEKYQYGNRFISSMRVFYWRKIRNISLLPNAGLLIEQATKDRSNEITQLYTGGDGLYFAPGIDIYLRRFVLGLNVTFPINETLNNGYANTQNRLATQILYLF